MSQKQGRQVRPLKEKLTPQQIEQRADRIQRRHGAAVTRGFVNSILALLNRGFFGRMQWLLFGK